MAAGDLKSQILLDIKSNGTGALDSARQGLAEVEAKITSLTTAMATGNASAAETQKELNKLGGVYKFLVGIIKELDPEYASLQAKLREMGERDAKAAADAQAKLNEGLRQGAAAVRDVKVAIVEEKAALAERAAALQRDEAAEAKHAEAVQRAAQDRAKLEASTNALLDQFADRQAKNKLREAELAERAMKAKQRAAEAAERDELRELERQSRLLAGYERWVAQQDAAAAATTRATGVMQNATRTNWVLTSSIQQVGYGLGDVAQASGDMTQKLMAATNNIQMITSHFGTWGVAVGLAITLAASLYRNWDSVVGLFEERSPFPKSADQLKVLNGEMATLKKRLGELDEAGMGNATQLEEYNKLLDRQLDLEVQITAEKQKQKDIDALKGLEPPQEKSDTDKRKKIAEDLLSEHKDEMIKSVAETFRKGAGREYFNAMEDVNKYTVSRDDPRFNEFNALREGALDRMKHYAKARGDTPEGFEINATAAQDLLAKFLKGDKGAADQLRGMVEGNWRDYPMAARGALARTSPDELASQGKAEALHGMRQKEATAVKKQREAEAKKLADESQETERLAGELAARVGKPVKDALEGRAQKMAAGGKTQAEILQEMMPDLVEGLQRQGAGKEAYGAANRLVTEAAEKALGARLTVALGGEMGAQGAARQVLGAEQQAADAKARKKGAAARRGAERSAKEDQLHEIAAGLESEHGLTPEQAKALAPRVLGGMQKGMTEGAAGDAAVASVRQFLQHQQKIMLRQQAQIEQMNGMFGEASQMLMMIEAEQRRFQSNISGQPSLLPRIPR